MAIMVGTGRARAGILIRNAEALELFGKVDTLIIDKTGPLTEGKPNQVNQRTIGAMAMLSRFIPLHTQLCMHTTGPMKVKLMSIRIHFIVGGDLIEYRAQNAFLKLYWCIGVIP
jgi:hypothetical protein